MMIFTFIIVIFLISLLFVLESFLLMSYLFIGKWDIAFFAFKDSLKTFFSKKERKSKLENSVAILNTYFKGITEEISELSDKSIQYQLNLDKNDAKKFKKIATDILKNRDTAFVSNEDIEKLLKREKAFNLFNLMASNVKILSNPKMALVMEIFNKNDVKATSDQFLLAKQILDALDLTPKQAEMKLKKSKKNLSRDKLFPLDIINEIVMVTNEEKLSMMYKALSQPNY